MATPVPITLLQVQYIQQGDNVYKVLVPKPIEEECHEGESVLHADHTDNTDRPVNPIICQVQDISKFQEQCLDDKKEKPHLTSFVNLSSQFRMVKSLVPLVVKSDNLGNKLVVPSSVASPEFELSGYAVNLKEPSNNATPETLSGPVREGTTNDSSAENINTVVHNSAVSNNFSETNKIWGVFEQSKSLVPEYVSKSREPEYSEFQDNINYSKTSQVELGNIRKEDNVVKIAEVSNTQKEVTKVDNIDNKVVDTEKQQRSQTSLIQGIVLNSNNVFPRAQPSAVVFGEAKCLVPEYVSIHSEPGYYNINSSTECQGKSVNIRIKKNDCVIKTAELNKTQIDVLRVDKIDKVVKDTEKQQKFKDYQIQGYFDSSNTVFPEAQVLHKSPADVKPGNNMKKLPVMGATNTSLPEHIMSKIQNINDLNVSNSLQSPKPDAIDKDQKDDMPSRNKIVSTGSPGVSGITSYGFHKISSTSSSPVKLNVIDKTYSKGSILSSTSTSVSGNSNIIRESVDSLSPTSKFTAVCEETIEKSIKRENSAAPFFIRKPVFVKLDCLKHTPVLPETGPTIVKIQKAPSLNVKTDTNQREVMTNFQQKKSSSERSQPVEANKIMSSAAHISLPEKKKQAAENVASSLLQEKTQTSSATYSALPEIKKLAADNVSSSLLQEKSQTSISQEHGNTINKHMDNFSKKSSGNDFTTVTDNTQVVKQENSLPPLIKARTILLFPKTNKSVIPRFESCLKRSSENIPVRQNISVEIPGQIHLYKIPQKPITDSILNQCSVTKSSESAVSMPQKIPTMERSIGILRKVVKTPMKILPQKPVETKVTEKPEISKSGENSQCSKDEQNIVGPCNKLTSAHPLDSTVIASNSLKSAPVTKMSLRNKNNAIKRPMKPPALKSEASKANENCKLFNSIEGMESGPSKENGSKILLGNKRQARKKDRNITPVKKGRPSIATFEKYLVSKNLSSESSESESDDQLRPKHSPVPFSTADRALSESSDSDIETIKCKAIELELEFNRKRAVNIRKSSGFRNRSLIYDKSFLSSELKTIKRKISYYKNKVKGLSNKNVLKIITLSKSPYSLENMIRLIKPCTVKLHKLPVFFSVKTKPFKLDRITENEHECYPEETKKFAETAEVSDSNSSEDEEVTKTNTPELHILNENVHTFRPSSCENDSASMMFHDPVSTVVKGEPPDIPDFLEYVDETLDVSLNNNLKSTIDFPTQFESSLATSTIPEQETGTQRIVEQEMIEIINEEPVDDSDDGDIDVVTVKDSNYNDSNLYFGQQYIHTIMKQGSQTSQKPKRKRRKRKCFIPKKYKAKKNFNTYLNTPEFQKNGGCNGRAGLTLNWIQGETALCETDCSSASQNTKSVDEGVIDLPKFSVSSNESRNLPIKTDFPQNSETEPFLSDSNLSVSSSDGPEEETLPNCNSNREFETVCEPHENSLCNEDYLHKDDNQISRNSDIFHGNNRDGNSSSYSVTDKYASLVKLIEEKSQLLKSYREKFGTS